MARADPTGRRQVRAQPDMKPVTHEYYAWRDSVYPVNISDQGRADIQSVAWRPNK
jgi:hypothetical protein